MSRIETGVSAARVLGRALANLVGSSVDVIGTVTSVAQGRVTIETSDKASVTVLLNPGLKRSPGDIAAEQLSCVVPECGCASVRATSTHSSMLS